jgi:hypothetical protein
MCPRLVLCLSAAIRMPYTIALCPRPIFRCSACLHDLTCSNTFALLRTRFRRDSPGLRCCSEQEESKARPQGFGTKPHPPPRRFRCQHREEPRASEVHKLQRTAANNITQRREQNAGVSPQMHLNIYSHPLEGLLTWPDAFAAPQAACSEVLFDSTVGRQCETHRAELRIAHSTSTETRTRPLPLSGGFCRVACVVEKFLLRGHFRNQSKEGFCHFETPRLSLMQATFDYSNS